MLNCTPRVLPGEGASMPDAIKTDGHRLLSLEAAHLQC